MAPNTHKINTVINQVDEKAVEVELSDKPRKLEIVYPNLIKFGYWYIASLYGLYLCFTSAKWATCIFCIIMYLCAQIGVTAGAHRLWTHRTYKAKLPLEILLMLFKSIAFQNTVTDWVRDHRLHHKYSDTEADPHNSTRGLFFSHIGWLLVRKSDEVKKRGKLIDMSDIHNNPVLKFQKKYAIPLIGAMCFVLPTAIPMYCWGESLNNAWHIAILRFTLNMNITFLVNSVAHYYGYRPYDKTIFPVQNLSVSLISLGEGFHNYHHAFPWDYRTAELGNNNMNLTTKFIDFFAWIGWAYDLKIVPDDMIRKRVKRTGDGTDLWGWGDKNMNDELKTGTEILYPKS